MSETRGVHQKVGVREILFDPLIWPIVLIILVFMAGFGLVFPVLPLFAKEFGVGNDGAGLFVGTFGFARLFGDLIGGTIVDRRGERWTAIVGLTFLGICSSATAAAPNFALAMTFWGLAGIGSAVTFASFFSYILKAAPPDRVGRTFSYFYGAFNVGVIAGGTVGGFLGEAVGLNAPLYGYTVMVVLAIVVYLRFVPQLPGSRASDAVEAAVDPATHAAGAEAPAPSRRVVRDLLKVRGFTTALFLNLSYLWIVGAVFNTLVPLFAHDELDMSPAGIGAVFSVAVAAEFVVLFPAGAWSDRFGRRAVVLPALVALTAMTVLVGFSPTPVMLALTLAFLAFASGIMGVPPAAMLSDVVPTEHSGRGVGAFRFAGDIGFFLGPLIAGAASQSFGFVPAFAITASVPAAAVLFALLTPETLRRDPTST
jgi:MFS family permease